VNQNSAIALQAPGGMLFGNVVRIRSDALTFEIEGVLSERAVMGWRMELSGHSDTVMGTLKVLRVRERPDGIQRCSSRILDMPARDRMRLSQWLKERATGGTTRRYDADVSAITQTSNASTVTLAETRNALKRMSQRKWHNTGQTSQTHDMLGLQSEVKTDATKKSGRAALRSALHTSMARKRDREEAVPSKPPVAASTAPRSDPEITRIPHTDPTRIQVRYHSATVYQADHHKHIRCSAMFISMPDLGGDGDQLRILIEPPGRAPVLCRAEIKVRMPSGVGVALRLTADQKRELEP
jgi:hypothetical protein